MANVLHRLEEPVSHLIEDILPDGSTRLVFSRPVPVADAAGVLHPRAPFIGFLANGTFILQDAYGSTITSSPDGNILIQAKGSLVFNATDTLVRNSTTGKSVAITSENL